MSYRNSITVMTAGVAAVLSLATSALADWRQTSGPAGGGVFILAADGDTAIAAGGTGAIFRSVDGGASWAHHPGGLSLATSFNEMVTPGGGHWFACSFYDLYYSEDDGLTWSDAAPATPLNDLHLRTSGGETYLTGRDANFDNVLYRFDTVGKTWEYIPAPVSVQGFLVEGDFILVSNETAYAPEVHRSYDGGETWEVFGDVETLPVLGFSDMVRVGLNVLALSQSDGIWESTDDGETWTQIVEPAEFSPTQMFLLGGDVHTLNYSGEVHRSRDGGMTWTQINNGLDGIRAIALSNDRYLAAAPQIHRSDDDAQSWTMSHDGIVATSPREFFEIDEALAVVQALPGMDFSFDGGETWTYSTDGLPGDVFITAYFQVDENVRLAGTSRDGVYRSTNGGQTWQPANSGIPTYKSGSFETSYHRPVGFARIGNDIFVATGGGREVIGGSIGQPTYTSTGAGVLRSTDFGQSWQLVRSGIPIVMINPLNGNTIYASAVEFAEFDGTLLLGCEASGVFRSTDMGSLWQDGNVGLPIRDDRVWAQATEFVEMGGTILLASRTIDYLNPHAPLFGSTDGGATWIEWTADLGDSRAITGLVKHNDHLVASLYPDYYNPAAPTFFESADGGTTWAPSEDNVAGLRINDLCVHDGNLLAASSLGVWRLDESLLGDMDNDGDVDLTDYAVLPDCEAGPEGEASLDCIQTGADLDADGDVDLKDFSLFQNVFTD
jgi:photosystem II stability/assembly factor-like uncharacterized protein